MIKIFCKKTALNLIEVFFYITEKLWQIRFNNEFISTKTKYLINALYEARKHQFFICPVELIILAQNHIKYNY